MRRILASTAVLLTLGALAGPTAAADDYVPRRMKAGEALWLLPTGRPHVYRGYFAAAWVWADVLDSTAHSQAWMFSGRCTVKTVKGTRNVGCIGDAVFSAQPPDSAFQVDPLLRSATLRIRNGRRTESVSWTGAGSPDVCGYGYGSGGSDPQDAYSGEGYCLSTASTASGDLFGRHVEATHRLDTSWFAEGLDTPAVPSPPQVVMRDGRAHLNLRIPAR